MQSDFLISKQAKKLKINLVAQKIGLAEEDLFLYGDFVAKIKQSAFKKAEQNENGNLILITSINPTPSGEGKTTVSIGLSDALTKIGKKSILSLREPSLGPVFGIKGGATGGGNSQVVPMEEINLHFTGDIHAVTTANNLLCALIDNHIFHGNSLKIDPAKITFHRCIDLNDRSLRNIVIGLNSNCSGNVRTEHFSISAASEIMAILCLAENLEDLKTMIGNILIGFSFSNQPIFVKNLNVQGAIAATLKDAINPNLVQTLNSTPALIHGGPFANIAHGCSSIRATKLALKLSDYVVTEAGFGSDLGAEKFFNIKCPKAKISAKCVVVVATIKSIKYNANIPFSELSIENLAAVKDGSCNLIKHINNIKLFNLPVVVALNKFNSDSEKEINLLREICSENGCKLILTEVFEKGGEGAIELAKEIVNLCSNESCFQTLYSNEDSLELKIKTVATKIYGASDVVFSKQAAEKLEQFASLGFNSLPVCIAKTQYSLSSDPKLLGCPSNFSIKIEDLKLNSGAGFVVALTSNINILPGLSKNPAANSIDVVNNEIDGIF